MNGFWRRVSQLFSFDGGADPQRSGDYPIRRIFIDVSTIRRHDARTGIQRVVRAIALQLGRHASPDLEILALEASRKFAYRITNLDFDDQTLPLLREKGADLALGAGDVFLGLDLAANLLPRYERQIARWQSNGARIALVLYDLLPYTDPDWFNRKTVKHFARWLGVLGRRADIVLPISHHVSLECRKYLLEKHPERADRIRSCVFPLSGDIAATAPSRGLPTDAEALLATLEGRDFLLMVGTVEPRKAHAEILAAHKRLSPGRGLDCPLLIIVGKAGWRSEAVQQTLSGLTLKNDHALWLSDVSDEMLDILYRRCSGLIAGSLNEGYCLPIAEALAYGKPVLARDIPVFREFRDSRLTYFDSGDEAALSRKIGQMAGAVAGVPSAKGGGWDISASALVAALTGAGPSADI